MKGEGNIPLSPCGGFSVGWSEAKPERCGSDFTPLLSPPSAGRARIIQEGERNTKCRVRGQIGLIFCVSLTPPRNLRFRSSHKGRIFVFWGLLRLRLAMTFNFLSIRKKQNTLKPDNVTKCKCKFKNA